MLKKEASEAPTHDHLMQPCSQELNVHVEQQ